MKTMLLTEEATIRHSKYFQSDKDFDKLLPLELRLLSAKHWTPIEVGEKAAKYLAESSNNPSILDIGAGVGKFCAIAGHFTNASITGIEQRPKLIDTGKQILNHLHLQDVQLLEANITQVNFDSYTAIYFYNAFYENIDSYAQPIDDAIERSPALFRYYTDYLYKRLQEMPVYTRLATYHTILSTIPSCYSIIESHFAGNLKFWIKYE